MEFLGAGMLFAYTQTLKGWQFVSSATTKAFTVEMYNKAGAMVGEYSSASPAAAAFAQGLAWTQTTGGASVLWNEDWAGFVVKTTVASTYAKDSTPDVPVTSANGQALAIGMPIGVVPQRFYDAYYGPGGAGAGSATAGFSNQVTPTVGTAAYVPGDCVGNVATLTMANAHSVAGRSVAIQSVAVTDHSKQSPILTFLWFKEAPTGTYTDGSPIVIATADEARYVGKTKIVAADWDLDPVVSPTVGEVSRDNLNKYVPLTGTSLYCIIMAGSSFSLTAGDIIATVSGDRK